MDCFPLLVDHLLQGVDNLQGGHIGKEAMHILNLVILGRSREGEREDAVDCHTFENESIETCLPVMYKYLSVKATGDTSAALAKINQESAARGAEVTTNMWSTLLLAVEGLGSIGKVC